MKRNITTVILSLFVSISYAQYQNTIDSGRPGNAISVFTVGKNVGQVEVGLDYSGAQEIFSSTPFLRYGILEKVEFNGGVNYNYSNSDLVSYNLGAKFNIFEGDSMIPSSAFFLNFNFPSNNLENKNATALFIFNHQFYNGLNITVNLGVNVDLEPTIRSTTNSSGTVRGSEITEFQGLYTLNFSYILNDKWTVFVEPYGAYDKFEVNKFSLVMNSGVSYLLNKNLLLDFLVGHGLTKSNRFLTVSTGVSWRIPFDKK